MIAPAPSLPESRCSIHLPAEMHRWHIVIGGFLQTQGEPTGMMKVWLRLHQRHAGRGTHVQACAWNDNWRDLAELIWRLSPDDDGPVVKIYAYSWGGGWGAVQLARQLHVRGIDVAHCVLCDAVYRSPWLVGRWLALLPWRIVMPRNVRKVTWFRQRLNWPAGHDIVAEDTSRTEIGFARWVECEHAYMDDFKAFHSECERVAAQ